MFSRFVDHEFSDLENANRSPIYGYQDLPLMSLEETLVSVSRTVSSLETYIPIAKRECRKGSTLITDEESAAIYLYSMPIEFYSELNKKLRSKNRFDLKLWFPFLRLFLSALEKLPSQEKLIWRGVHGNIGSEFFENQMHVWWGINSCSTSLEVIEVYLGDGGTIFAISAINAKDISYYSAFPEEKEFVLLPGSRLRAKTTRLNFRNTLYVADLEEYREVTNNLRSASKNRNKMSRTSRILENRKMNRMFQTSGIDKRYQENNEPSTLVEATSRTLESTHEEARSLEGPIDLRSAMEKPILARDLPRKVCHGSSKLIAANDRFIIFYGDSNLHVFDENLKLVRSTKHCDFDSSELKDIIWCAVLHKFIVLTTTKVFGFDPLSTELMLFRSIKFQYEEKEKKFVACTYSPNTLFIATSDSYYPYYVQQYSLPEVSFISCLTVDDLIGNDQSSNAKLSFKSRDKKSQDERQIINMRYNACRLGIVMECDYERYLYVLNLTTIPTLIDHTELPRIDGYLVGLTKSGEWLYGKDSWGTEIMKISQGCQLASKFELDDNAQSSYFSFSTGFVKLKESILQLTMMGSSTLVALRSRSLALYQI